jgi:hypothetical protein
VGARDVQVNGCADIREAIDLCEKVTGCRVDHGRGGIGSKFNPGVIIDAVTGDVVKLHDRDALVSMQVVNGARVTVPRGA